MNSFHFWRIVQEVLAILAQIVTILGFILLVIG